MTVELDDAPLPANGMPAEFTADDYVVHEQDVHAVINALWAGGAEAVAVMDQRVIGTSAVRCVGSTLLIHGRVYPPPYRITAIGPAERMQRALDLSPALGHLPSVRGSSGARARHRRRRVIGGTCV